MLDPETSFSGSRGAEASPQVDSITGVCHDVRVCTLNVCAQIASGCQLHPDWAMLDPDTSFSGSPGAKASSQVDSITGTR